MESRFKNKTAIWLTWEKQVRNRSLAEALNIPLCEIDISGPRINRYFKSIKATWNAFKQHKPDVVCHQNPSIVLAIVVLFFKLFFKYKVVVDCHNAAVHPFEGRSKFFTFLAKVLAKSADLVIVHNQSVAKTVDIWGVNYVILPDPLPTAQKIDEELAKYKQPYALYICSWSDDEPYEEVIKAGQQLLSNNSNITIYITGKPSETLLYRTLPSNIELTGFLSYEDYLSLLINAKVVMALTLRDNSLNCGGYESLTYEKPCILSKSPVLEDFFGEPFIFTKNSALSIAASIVEVVDKNEELTLQVKARKVKYLDTYKSLLDNFIQKLQTL